MVRIHPDPPSFRHGAIAQLGERLLCKQEVIGSIPIGSTSFVPGGRSNQRRVRRCLVLPSGASNRRSLTIWKEGSCLLRKPGARGLGIEASSGGHWVMYCIVPRWKTGRTSARELPKAL